MYELLKKMLKVHAILVKMHEPDIGPERIKPDK